MRDTKRKVLEVLINAKRAGKVVAGYGAPGKGNTLLNYCGIRTDFIDFTVDRNPYKHGRFLPGTHIPIFPPDHIEEARPDYIFVLPWNLKRRDHGAARPCARLGREVHHPHPRSRGCLMLPFTLGASAGPAPPLRILCLGAHSDDIEIGCGGTVLRLLGERPGSSVSWVVFSATPEREREARASAADFLAQARENTVVVNAFRESFFPTSWADIKNSFEEDQACGQS